MIFVLRAQSSYASLSMPIGVIDYLDDIFPKLSKQRKDSSDLVLCWIVIIVMCLLVFRNL